MRAWLLDSLSGLGALRLVDDFPIPTPTANEVLIRLSHAALNPADRFLAENLYPARPTFPHILGRDGCGVIQRLGGDVRHFHIGDRVELLRNEPGVTRPGTFAEYVAVPEDWLSLAPPKWTDAESAAGPLVYLTAHQALTQWEPPNSNGAGATGGLSAGAPNLTVLITGASGGVGIASIHLAKAYGYRVIALSRGTAKIDRLRAEGADLVLDPGDKELKSKTKGFTGGRGVDLVVDNIGGDLFDRAIDTLGFLGKISVVGMLGGPIREFNTARLLFKRVRVGGVLVSDYSPDVARMTWQSIVEVLDRTGRRPIVDQVFPFDQLIAAFSRLEQGPFGKVILKTM